MKMRRLITILLCGVMLVTGCGNSHTEDIPELLNPVGKSISETGISRKDLYGTKVYN